jgi:hypothetical protein
MARKTKKNFSLPSRFRRMSRADLILFIVEEYGRLTPSQQRRFSEDLARSSSATPRQ